MFIDTHCHLDSGDYDDDYAQIIAHCRELGLERIVIPGASLPDLPKAMHLSEQFDYIYFAVGIHPNEIAQLDLGAKRALSNALTHEKCVAVGEIGLDYHYLDSNESQAQKRAQEDGFRFQIELAIANNKPIIIHSRESNEDILKILRDYESQMKAVIFHCFGGDLGLVGALKCPCFYGIGGVVSFKNAHSLRLALPKMPLDSLILETDAPYLAPSPHRGKRNTPEFIPLINAKLAEVLNMDEKNLAQITTKNAKAAFDF